MVKHDSPEHADAVERARAALRVVPPRTDASGRASGSARRDAAQDREQVLRDSAGAYVLSSAGALDVEAGRREPLEPGGAPALGISVVQQGAMPASRLRLEPTGLVILTVAPGSRAARAGLRPGDVIERVNRQPLADVGVLRRAVMAMDIEPLLLQVVRHDTRFFITANVW